MSKQTDTYLYTLSRLELGVDPGINIESALASIAISLKRIADIMSLPPAPQGRGYNSPLPKGIPPDNTEM